MAAAESPPPPQGWPAKLLNLFCSAALLAAAWIHLCLVLPAQKEAVDRAEKMEAEAGKRRADEARHNRLMDAARRQQIRNAADLLLLQEDALKAARAAKHKEPE